MTTNLLQALVLHKHWSGDTSARVHFFTRELGLISCLCKGGRTPKKQALLQAFTPIWLGVDERYEQFFMRTVENTEPPFNLLGQALFSGLYLNELLYYALKPAYPDPQLFDAYCATLDALAKAKDRLAMEAVLRRFEWTLLLSSGYGFSLTTEARSDMPIDKDACYQFIATEGFVKHANGLPGAHILALAEDNLGEIAYLKSAKIIMRKAIDNLIGGREIKARSLYVKPVNNSLV